jgi:hypothetical protein
MAVLTVVGLVLCVAVAAIAAAFYQSLVQQGRILQRLEALEVESRTSLPGPRKGVSEPRSLFIVSLPRSLSSLVYFMTQRAFLLKESPNVSEGEILNGDRYASYGVIGESAWKRFTRKELDPGTFYLSSLILDHVVQSEGHIYKDVVQPFVVADWLVSRELHILHLTRCLPDVAFAMLQKDWLYPSTASEHRDDRELAFLEGLVRADQALLRLPAVRADYDDLVSDEETLWSRLRHLYPERPMWRTPFIDAQFRLRRAEILSRRKTREYRRLEERIADMRQRLGPAIEASTT